MPVPKGVDARKYDDCVDQVKAKRGGVNPWAVCASSMKRSKGRGRKNKRSRR